MKKHPALHRAERGSLIIVGKIGKPPNKTAIELRQEAKALLSKPGKKVDTVPLLRKLRE